MADGSVESLLDSRPRAGRGNDNATDVTCCSIASSNFISVAELDFHERRRLLRKGFTELLVEFIPIHKTHVSPATTFTADDVCQLYGRSHATASPVHRLTMYYRTSSRGRHNQGLNYYLYTTTQYN